jgi:hypothetical protein
MVEYKAVTAIVRTTHFLKVFQDTAIQLVDTVIAYIAHIYRCFLAAYAAGTESDDRFII